MKQNENIKILIVEDEAAVRRSLKGKISKYNESCYVIEEAKNAEQAHEMIKLSLPDLIFLDMKMPGMGGMAFLEILNAEYPSVKVIILSGFSDFEYVKKGLKCGAIDYLLKPIIKEELYKAISIACESIDQNRQKLRNEIKKNVLLQQSVALLKNNLLNDLLYSSQKNIPEILKKLSLLNIAFDYSHYVIVNIYILNYSAMESYFMKDPSLLFFALDNVMAETLDFPSNIINFISENKENEMVCIVGFHNKEEIKGLLKEGFQQLIHNAKKYNKIHLQVMISEDFARLDEAYLYYKKSSTAWKENQPASEVCFVGERIKEEGTHQPSNGQLPQQEAGTLYRLLEEQDVKALTTHINLLFAARSNSSVSSITLASDIYHVVEDYYHKKNGRNNTAADFLLPTLSEFLLKYETELEMRLGLNRIVSQLYDALQNEKSRMGAKQIVLEIQDYIQKYYYDSELSLETLSKMYFINRSYLSEIFRVETCLTFKKYITQVRLEKAKELVTEKHVKMSDVAYLVGFNDPSYFAIVFKKHIGLSVKEYNEGYATK